jgi:hypothetical protein
MPNDIIQRTPTETIVAAMEEAETAKECLVIMTSEDGSIITLGSTSILSTRLGLLEMAKAMIIRDIVRMEER